MWLVSETMADGGALGAEVPESVQHERNYPEHAVVAILSLAPALGTRGVGTAHTITATAAMRPDGRSQEWRSTSPSSVPRTVARSRS